jgi:LAO/AO transport system kinase
MQENKFESALNVNKGIEQPPTVNPYISNFYKEKRVSTLSEDDYLDGILKGNTTILSQAITLIESSKAEHRVLAQKLIAKALPHVVKSRRVGITGVPGAGKSTFIEAFGSMITSMGHKLAVLAIDPSSEKSKGSILGDKTRMETLCNDPNAFIRPTPSSGSLGGVARKTRESIILCEAAGFDVIFIETVGVGQSETAVHSMSDLFLLLMLAGAGDELQGMKRGIMEMSDIIAITKADGSNKDKATLARALYSNALHLFPKSESGWVPVALTTSAVTREGLEDVLDRINEYFTLTESNGFYNKKRREQSRYWMYESINEELLGRFFENPSVTEKREIFEEMVLNGEISSFAAASELVRIFEDSKNNNR